MNKAGAEIAQKLLGQLTATQAVQQLQQIAQPQQQIQESQNIHIHGLGSQFEEEKRSWMPEMPIQQEQQPSQEDAKQFLDEAGFQDVKIEEQQPERSYLEDIMSESEIQEYNIQPATQQQLETGTVMQRIEPALQIQNTEQFETEFKRFQDEVKQARKINPRSVSIKTRPSKKARTPDQWLRYMQDKGLTSKYKLVYDFYKTKTQEQDQAKEDKKTRSREEYKTRKDVLDETHINSLKANMKLIRVEESQEELQKANEETKKQLQDLYLEFSKRQNELQEEDYEPIAPFARNMNQSLINLQRKVPDSRWRTYTMIFRLILKCICAKQTYGYGKMLFKYLYGEVQKLYQKLFKKQQNYQPLGQSDLEPTEENLSQMYEQLQEINDTEIEVLDETDTTTYTQQQQQFRQPLVTELRRRNILNIITRAGLMSSLVIGFSEWYLLQNFRTRQQIPLTNQPQRQKKQPQTETTQNQSNQPPIETQQTQNKPQAQKNKPLNEKTVKNGQIYTFDIDSPIPDHCTRQIFFQDGVYRSRVVCIMNGKKTIYYDI